MDKINFDDINPGMMDKEQPYEREIPEHPCGGDRP